MDDFLADLRHEFGRHKDIAERAMAQLDEAHGIKTAPSSVWRLDRHGMTFKKSAHVRH